MGTINPAATAADAADDDTICLISPTLDGIAALAGARIGDPPCVDAPFIVANDITFNETTGEVASGRAALATALGMEAEQAVYTLGWDYKNVEVSRPKLRWVTDVRARCLSEQDFVRRSMPSGWNDRVRSARVHSASYCGDFIHYEHAGFGGAQQDCAPDTCWFLGVMDSQTSSVRFS